MEDTQILQLQSVAMRWLRRSVEPDVSPFDMWRLRRCADEVTKIVGLTERACAHCECRESMHMLDGGCFGCEDSDSPLWPHEFEPRIPAVRP